MEAPKKYTKKQITVDALQWTGSNHRAMFDFLTESSGEHFHIDFNAVEYGLVIHTSEGDMVARMGDFIVKEPFDKKRNFYPVKADIFIQTYVDEDAGWVHDGPPEASGKYHVASFFSNDAPSVDVLYYNSRDKEWQFIDEPGYNYTRRIICWRPVPHVPPVPKKVMDEWLEKIKEK